jgi:hypothetical protein
MINKPQIFVLSTISVSIFIAFSYFSGLDTLNDWARLISTLAAVIGFIATLFIKILWKIPFLYPWFCEVPNLNGTWEAEIKSNVSPNNIKIQKGIEIKQNYKNISLSFETNESRSETMTANFVKTAEGQKLLYTYINEPNMNLRKRSPMHLGASQLHWNETEKDVLKGHYWTDRGSTGSIYLIKQ